MLNTQGPLPKTKTTVAELLLIHSKIRRLAERLVQLGERDGLIGPEPNRQIFGEDFDNIEDELLIEYGRQQWILRYSDAEDEG